MDWVESTVALLEVVSAWCTDHPVATTWILLALTLFHFRQRKLAREQLIQDQQTIVVIGADDGVGALTVRFLDRMGHIVYAGCCNEELARELQSVCSRRVMVRLLDISDPNSATRFCNSISQVWAVVHNLSIYRYCPIEWLGGSTLKALLEHNVTSVHTLLCRLLPALRRSSGRVVFVTDPTATKAGQGSVAQSLCNRALSGYIECLRLEMKNWKVRVVEVKTPLLYSKPRYTRIREGLSSEFERVDPKVRREYGSTFFSGFDASIKRSVKGLSREYKPIAKVVLQAVLATDPDDVYGSSLWKWFFTWPASGIDLAAPLPSAIRRTLKSRSLF